MPSGQLSRRALSKGSLGALAGCAAVALLSLGSGLDRAAQVNPALGARVPGPFASQAIRSQARAALAGQDKARALDLAAAAVADAPTDPESTALLGMARYASGDMAGAEQAFRIAGQLGWRNRLTQAYWMERALELGDYRVAAMRLDALLRQQPDLLANRTVMNPLELSAEGRAALAERMERKPAWLIAYGTQVAGLGGGVLQQRSLVLDEAARLGVTLGCEPVAPLVEAMVKSGQASSAGALWRQHCPGAARTLVHDGDFATASIEQNRSQFAWTFLGQSDVSLLLEWDLGNSPAQRLVVEGQPRAPRQFLRQLVLVRPGKYRLSWRTTKSDPDAPNHIRAALSCTADPREWLEPRHDRASRQMVIDLTVDATCQAHWLAFATGAGEINETMGAVRLAPIN